jgi:subtilisin family serine protease
MSLGGVGDPVGSCASTSEAQHQAICNATAAGINFVVAAGNDAWGFDLPAEPGVPAAYPQVLTVTAVSDSDGLPGAAGGAPGCRFGEPDDGPATFSNFATTAAGAAHTIAAPGVCINSTVPGGGHAQLSGTSMASPHMAGLVALCIGEGGTAGPCAALQPPAVISYLRAQAQSYNGSNPGYGFNGDPIHPIDGSYFGFLQGPLDQFGPPPAPKPGGTGSTRATNGPAQAPAGRVLAKASSNGAQSWKRLRRGRFTYSFRATRGTSGSASFTSVKKVRVSARRKVTLARKSFSVPGSGKVTLRIKLSKKNLRILRRNRKIQLRVTVKLVDAAGLTSTAKSTLTLRS